MTSERALKSLRTNDEDHDESSKSYIDIKVAEKYGFHPLIHISNGNIWLNVHLMVLFIINTGFGKYQFSHVKLYMHTGEQGGLRHVHKKRRFHIKFTEQMTQIRYGQFEKTHFLKKTFSIDEGYKYISRTVLVFQTLLASRATDIHVIVISLKMKMEEDILGCTHFENNRVIISLNYEKIKCLEQLLLTVIHELAHVLEGCLNIEDHGFSFYSLHMALNAIFLQSMRDILPIDFELFKVCRVAAEAKDMDHKPITNVNGPIIIID